MKKIKIILSKLENSQDCHALVGLINEYILDKMGGGKLIGAAKACRLIKGLKEHSGNCIFFAKNGRDYVGLCICFLGFSTFDARKILNIHDLIVTPLWRQKGIGKNLLKAAEQKAREMGCSKMTLEVRIDNSQARYLYKKGGFGECQNPMDFWIKRLIRQ